MGIPFYFGEIIAKSPVNKRFNIIADKLPKSSKRFFLDFNSIIHPCSAKVISKLNTELEVNDNLYKMIFDNIAEYTIKLIDIIKPSDLVYIAIDGVAPRAKMNQQRKRRYLSAQRNEKIIEFKNQHNIHHTNWDSNCITPGTVFMDKLNAYLTKEFSKMINNKFPLLKNLIISSSEEEGEGEHKMIHYIKCQPLDNGTDVIYGLDADLIMLSLTSHNSDIVLMREAQDFGHLQSRNKVPFKYLIINNLRDSIYDTLNFNNITNNNENDNYKYQSLINDYVFICFMLGNDFIPSLSFLKIKDGAVDILIESYTKSCLSTNETIITFNKNTKQYGINLNILEAFMMYMQNQEDENMEYVVNHFNNVTPKPPRNFNNTINIIKQNNHHMTHKEAQDKALRDFTMDLEEFPLRNKPQYDIDPKNDKKWRSSYYHYVFGENNPEIIKQSCKNYVEGLLWIVNYYFNLQASKEWYCYLHYAPSASDIYKYLLSITNEDIHNELLNLQLSKNNSNVNKAHLQLLLVLPPQSKHLLPNNLQHIMTDINYGCVHFYPHKFNVMTYLKSKMWECSPIIPNIDVPKVICAMITCLESTNL
jgi:5'-3' exoribonuclease 1